MKKDVTRSAQQWILFLPHAILQMSRPDRMITPVEVENTVLDGLVIEEFVDDPRGESCLMMHKLNDRCIHVVCAPKLDFLAIITAYIPEEELWENDYKTGK